MNGAAIHLALNHLPIWGLLIGLGILAGGIFGKQPSLRKAAYILILVASMATLPVNLSGESAVEVVETLSDSRDRDLIHEHEEAAELGLFLMLALGIISLAALVMERRNHPRQGMAANALFGLGIIIVGFIAYVGHLGGQISHPEIRPGFVVPSVDHHGNHHDSENVQIDDD